MLNRERDTTPSLERTKTEQEKDEEGIGTSSGVQDRQYQHELFDDTSLFGVFKLFLILAFFIHLCTLFLDPPSLEA